MNERYTGRCACGAVTYGFNSEPTFVANCHCTDCKRASGGEMATFVAVPEKNFAFNGTTTSFSYGPSTETCAGQGLDRVFCSACGCRVFTNNLKDGSGLVFVQQGTFDRLDGWFPPRLEIFTWSRQKWMPALAVPQFDRGPK
jgi:hypothetical protein